MKIKLIIFDLDGTLVDAFRAVVDSINFSLKKLGYEPQDEDYIKRSVGWGERSLLATFVDEKDLDTLQALYRESHAKTLAYGVKFLDGASELLERLKSEGYKLAIATNRSFWSTKIILQELNAEKYFDAVLTKDEVDLPKPNAEILERLIKEFGLELSQAIYVGDMTVDVETGKNAGVATIAVTTGSSTREELEQLNPFKVIENVLGVAGVLDEVNSFVLEGDNHDR